MRSTYMPNHHRLLESYQCQQCVHTREYNTSRGTIAIQWRNMLYTTCNHFIAIYQRNSQKWDRALCILLSHQTRGMFCIYDFLTRSTKDPYVLSVDKMSVIPTSTKSAKPHNFFSLGYTFFWRELPVVRHQLLP